MGVHAVRGAALAQRLEALATTMWKRWRLTAPRADAFHHVLDVLGDVAVGQRDLGQDDVGQADRAVADPAAEMDMAHPRQGVAAAPQTVFLRTRPVIDRVNEVMVAEQGECSEQGGFIDGGQCLLHVRQVENPGELAVHRPPYQQPHRRHTDIGFAKGLFFCLSVHTF